MTLQPNRMLRAPLGELWPLLAVGIGVAGLLRGAQAAGELLSILEWTGALGGDAQP
jgi:hypothetical protein